MKRVSATIVFFLILACSLQAKDKKQVVFSATIVRIQPWGLAKIACGITQNFRLVEYQVDMFFQGNLNSRIVVVQHLACNYNELEELKAGDSVIVVADVMPSSERRFWGNSLSSDTRVEPLSVMLNAKAVAKVVYPAITAK